MLKPKSQSTRELVYPLGKINTASFYSSFEFASLKNRAHRIELALMRYHKVIRWSCRILNHISFILFLLFFFFLLTFKDHNWRSIIDILWRVRLEYFIALNSSITRTSHTLQNVSIFQKQIKLILKYFSPFNSRVQKEKKIKLLQYRMHHGKLNLQVATGVYNNI